MGFVNKISTNLPSTVLAVGELGVARLTGKLYVGDGTSSGDSANTVVNAFKADKLSTARTIALTGDVTYTSGGFDGSGNVTGAATLANSGVTAGIYRSVTVDAKGRVTSGTNPTTLSEYGITELLGAIGNINSPLLDLPLKNSLAMKAGVGSATFTRASTATYIDRYGVLKTAAVDEPRFEKEGYLNEGASTNLLTYSEQFDNAAWGKVRTALSANTTDTLDPYGTNLADKLVSSVDVRTHYIRQDTSVNPSTTYTASCFFKAGASSSISIQVVAKNASAAEVVLTNSGYNFSTDITSGGIITKLSNGWVRLQATVTTLSDSTSLSIRLGNNSGVHSTTDYIYLFGAQLEALPFATSYIPTVASTVTRAADNLTLSADGNYNLPADKKTIILDYDILGYGTENQTLFDLTGGAYNRILSFSPGLAAPADRPISYYGGGPLAFTPSSVPANTKNRLAYLLPSGTATQNATRYWNGVYYATTSQTIVTDSAPTTLCIGRASWTMANNHFGHISNVRVYDKALSATEIALA